jgi:hypothetical protein
LTVGRPHAAQPRHRARLLPSGMCLPALPLLFGALAWMADAHPIGATLLASGVALLGVGLGSSLEYDADGNICVRHWSLRTRCLRAAEITGISTRTSEIFPRAAPKLEIAGRQGKLLTIQLGAWQGESQFLRWLDSLAVRTGSRTDGRARQLFRRRPSGWFWQRRQMRRGPRARPFRRQGLQQAVYVSGVVTVVIGLAMVVYVDRVRPGIGSLGFVPEAIVSMNAIVLGLMAVLMARPRREVKRLVGFAFVPLAVAFIVTAGTLVVALSEIVPTGLMPVLLRSVILTMAYASVLITLTLGGIVLVLKVGAALLRRLTANRFV